MTNNLECEFNSIMFECVFVENDFSNIAIYNSVTARCFRTGNKKAVALMSDAIRAFE